VGLADGGHGRRVGAGRRHALTRFDDLLHNPPVVTIDLTPTPTRSLDLLLGGIGSLLTAPLVAVLALLVRLESPGHPIYTQTRVGRNGRTFAIYKLRTMVHGAEHTGAGLAIAEGDDRITRVGALLRRYSLDELPNLWNVVKGEMSIVGPRPTVVHQVEQYTPRQRGRLAVKPGITGWAQIHGRASLPWPERIELDLWYVEHRSLVLDLKVLARTVGLVLGGHGIYKGDTGGWVQSPGGDCVQSIDSELGSRVAHDRIGSSPPNGDRRA
jgi:lipopolysaccharide/colanic/teichoic acid biosynthesis glycosyltransferase